MPLTPSQELAAATRGRPILVSAAAGSGKTRVLVERLMRYIDSGEDIDRFLVITYTRAAAAELKSRILRELNERISAEPANRRLRRQTELLSRASIGTIDSICGRLLREYVHLTALTPDFRLIEEERAAAMRRSALNRLLEGRYEHIESDEAFRALADSVGAGKDDSKLEALVLSLCDSLRSHSKPAAWIESCRRALDVSGLADASETPWGRYLLDRSIERAEFWADRLRESCALMAAEGHEKLFAAYGEGFYAAADALEALSACAERGWDEARKALPIPLKIKAFRGTDELKERCKALWDNCRKACEKLTEELSEPSAGLLEELGQVRPAMEALLDLAAELEDAYAADKRRAGVVDFSDQEHMVLELLERESSVREELSGRWREVMVDEYQDVNECQDRLFTALSHQGEHLFLVGDVKQSIYRFRLADPGIFLGRYESFAAVEDSPGSTEAGRILLRENFRSSPAVIDAANFVFTNILSRTLGELDYDEAARLLHGRTENGDYAAPEAALMIYAVPENDAGEEKVNKTELEAAAVAQKIRALLDAPTLIPDGEGGLRPLQKRDIAILLRSYKNVAPRYQTALAREGISCSAEQSGGFFRSLEITVLMNLLSVIDNPRQDIPLISVLRSPLYGFTADELSAIRTADSHGDFYTALQRSAHDAHCAAFLRELEGYRALAPELSVAELLESIIQQSELEALLSALPDGENRRKNVELLRLYALQFEQGGYKGLFRFVSWLADLAERGKEPAGASVAEGDAVSIMTIHRSKGLEFPVVFLCDTAHQFNLRDSKEAVLIHPTLGIGAKHTDTARGIIYPTLCWRAVSACIRRESLSEELRVLYVAMTRAREQLYITAAWDEPQKKLNELSGMLTAPVSPLLLEDDKSMSQWLARCALLGDKSLVLRLEETEAQQKNAPLAQGEESAKEETVWDIREALQWRYAYAGAESLPSKLTVSQLKGEEYRDEDSAYAFPQQRVRRNIDLSDEARPLSAAERGTAVHVSLQFIDYARCGTIEGIKEELARLYARGHLREEQYKAVDPHILHRFFRSDLGQRILRADKVYREQSFTLLLPASTLPGGSEEDEILLQGVVDCCIEEQGELTVIDYKTDYVTEETLEAKAEGYARQVQSYTMAMERIRGMKVREGILYFLGLGRAVKVYP